MGDHRCRNQVSLIGKEPGSVTGSLFFKPGVGQYIALPVATDVNAYEFHSDGFYICHESVLTES